MSKPQLFCFTYAGGNAAFFDILGKDLPEHALVCPEYPGHGTRHREPFCASFDELAGEMFRSLKEQYAGGTYGLLGYSMGAITAAEVLKRILADPDLPAPAHVFLAAHEPHTKAELAGYDPAELDEWVKERTIRFGDVPEKLLNNRSFWRMYLPIYRADYSLIGGYKFEDLDLRTGIPLTVFYSETDTPLEDMRQWTKFFIGECEFIEYPGNHFFIREHHEAMAENIRRNL